MRCNADLIHNAIIDAWATAQAELGDDDDDEQIQQMLRETGLESAADVEDKLVRDALDDVKVKGSAAFAAAVERSVQQGANIDEAVSEAILNQASIMGNMNMEDEDADEAHKHVQETAAHHVGGHSDSECARPRAASSSSSLPTGSRALAIDMSAAFALYQDELNKSLDALQRRLEAMRSRSVGQDKELSLVLGRISGGQATSSEGEGGQEEAEAVFYVHWKDADLGKRLGRPASLDEQNRVKCIVATGSLREARDYRHAQIIHPVVGVRMERVRGYKGMLRPAVGSSVLRLFQIWNLDQARLAAQRDSAGVLGTAPSECFICNRAPEIWAVGDEGRAARVQVCPCCTLSAHSSCMSRLVDYSSEHGVSLTAMADLSSIDLSGDPFVFEDSARLRQQSLHSRCKSGVVWCSLMEAD